MVHSNSTLNFLRIRKSPWSVLVSAHPLRSLVVDLIPRPWTPWLQGPAFPAHSQLAQNSQLSTPQGPTGVYLTPWLSGFRCSGDLPAPRLPRMHLCLPQRLGQPLVSAWLVLPRAASGRLGRPCANESHTRDPDSRSRALSHVGGTLK